MVSANDLRDNTLYCAECTREEVPAGDFWLTSEEQLRLRALHVPKRRDDWRLGRWTAKCAVRAWAQLDGRDFRFTDIEIRVRSSGAPYAWVQGECINLSISHSHGVALCVVSHSRAPIGCDIEFIEPRSDVFVRDYLTPAEQVCVAETVDQQQKDILVTLFWCAKESALKALQSGLRLDVARVNVRGNIAIGSSQPPQSAADDHWRSVEITVADRRTFSGWWCHAGRFLRVVIGEPPQPLPRYSTVVDDVRLGNGQRDWIAPDLSTICSNGPRS